jgi:hypothetical protein
MDSTYELYRQVLSFCAGSMAEGSFISQLLKIGRFDLNDLWIGFTDLFQKRAFVYSYIKTLFRCNVVIMKGL